MMFNFSGNGVFKGDWYFNPDTGGNSQLKNTSNPNFLNQWIMLSAEFDMSDNGVVLSYNGTSYATGTKEAVGNIGSGGTLTITDHQGREADSD